MYIYMMDMEIKVLNNTHMYKLTHRSSVGGKRVVGGEVSLPLTLLRLMEMLLPYIDNLWYPKEIHVGLILLLRSC